MLICPGVATGERTPEQVWDTGFMVIFKPLWPSDSKLYSFHFPLSTASYFLPSVIPITTVQPNSLLLSTVPLLILKLSSHPTQPTPQQLTSSNPTSTVHRSLKRLANLFTCLKPIQLHVVVFGNIGYVLWSCALGY